MEMIANIVLNCALIVVMILFVALVGVFGLKMIVLQSAELLGVLKSLFKKEAK